MNKYETNTTAIVAELPQVASYYHQYYDMQPSYVPQQPQYPLYQYPLYQYPQYPQYQYYPDGSYCEIHYVSPQIVSSSSNSAVSSSKSSPQTQYSC